MVAKKPAHQGEHEGNRNTIVAGNAGLTGVTVVTLLVCFFISHARLRAQTASGISRALFSTRDIDWQSPDAKSRRGRGLSVSDFATLDGTSFRDGARATKSKAILRRAPDPESRDSGFARFTRAPDDGSRLFEKLNQKQMVSAIAPRRQSALSPLVGESWRGGYYALRHLRRTPLPNPPPQGGREKKNYNPASTALPISAVPLLPPNSIGRMPCA